MLGIVVPLEPQPAIEAVCPKYRELVAGAELDDGAGNPWRGKLLANGAAEEAFISRNCAGIEGAAVGIASPLSSNIR